MREGGAVGSKGDPASGIPWRREQIKPDAPKLGVSVMGVSNVDELNETMRVWRSILDGLEGGEKTAVESGRGTKDRDWSLSRQRQVQELAVGIRKVLGEYLDFAWASPPPGFRKPGLAPTVPAPLPTPEASPDHSPDHCAIKLPAGESMDVSCSDLI